MARAKTHLFKQNDAKLAEFAKVLAHPARIAILKALSTRTECVCGEIVDVVPLAQATVSQHLKELKSIGLISGEIDGPKSCYWVNWERFSEVAVMFDELFRELKTNHERCC